MYNTYMFSVYVISLVIVGTWCSNNKEMLSATISAKHFKKKGKSLSGPALFVGVYISPFIPVFNSFLVVLLTLGVITKMMINQK